MSERYLYSVHPKRVIKNLSDTIPVIRTNKTLSLTLDEVRICLKSATVYRRFANENRIERVTISNVERFHNARFMTEKEYEDFKAQKEEIVKVDFEKKEVEIIEEISSIAETKDKVINTSTSILVDDIPVVEETKEEVAEEKKEAITGIVTDYSGVKPQSFEKKKDYGGKNKNHR